MTLLACVSAGGDALTPMIISQAPIRHPLSSLRLRQDKDVTAGQRNPAYIDEELFREYLTSVINLQNDAGLSGEIAVCLVDSALPHVSERRLRLLGANRVLAVAFPAHTTNIFQPLDLAFFGALKHLKASSKGEFCDGSVNDQITKLVQAYEQTATSGTIRGSFRKAGLIPNSSVRPFRLEFNEETLRHNPGFKVTWDRNIKIEQMSRRRQSQRFRIFSSECIVK
jgi:hypothetical protein